MVSVCSHRHMNILDAAALYRTMTSSNTSNSMETIHDRVISYTSGLFQALQRLKAILTEAEVNKLPLNNLTMERMVNKDNVDKWISVKDELTKRSLLSTLLPGPPLRHLSNKQEELVVYCRKAGLPCATSLTNVKVWYNPDFFRCFSFNIIKGDYIDEATSQGIRNGITFVFLAGSKMINSLTDSLMSIPGFDNSLSPSSGTDGIRISIHENSTTPNPSLEGIDIPPGVSATIGVVSKEIHRLEQPYSNCTNHNVEIDLLMKIMKRDLKHVKKQVGEGVVEGSYRIADCRSTCLQR